MLKRMLIGLMVVALLLIGIHLSWGGPYRKCHDVIWGNKLTKALEKSS